MDQLGRFMTRPIAEKLLFVRAAILLGCARLSLAVLPLRATRRVLSVMAWCPLRQRRGLRVSAREVSWAVASASRVVPGADTCLYRAFAAEAILVGSGSPVELMFGFGRDDDGSVRGHAWTESDGVVVTGAEELDSYGTVVRLPSRGEIEAVSKTLIHHGRGRA